MFLNNPTLGLKEAYVPGLTKEYVSQTYGVPVDDVAKLGSAENPFGPSPKAAAAVKAAMKLETYPDWDRPGTAREDRGEIGLFRRPGDLRRGRD